MAELKAPVNVSPLIRFGRWSALVAGITYGVIRRTRLAAKEKVIRENARIEKERMAPIIAAERKRRSDLEIQSLADQIGSKI